MIAQGWEENDSAYNCGGGRYKWNERNAIQVLKLYKWPSFHPWLLYIRTPCHTMQLFLRDHESSCVIQICGISTLFLLPWLPQDWTWRMRMSSPSSAWCKQHVLAPTLVSYVQYPYFSFFLFLLFISYFFYVGKRCAILFLLFNLSFYLYIFIFNSDGKGKTDGLTVTIIPPSWVVTMGIYTPPVSRLKGKIEPRLTKHYYHRVCTGSLGIRCHYHVAVIQITQISLRRYNSACKAIHDPSSHVSLCLDMKISRCEVTTKQQLTAITFSRSPRVFVVLTHRKFAPLWNGWIFRKVFAGLGNRAAELPSISNGHLTSLWHILTSLWDTYHFV